MVFDVMQDIIAEPRQITGNGWYAAGHAFQGRISPWLVVTWKYPQMTAPHKLNVVHAKNRITGCYKIRMVNNFDIVSCDYSKAFLS